MVQPLNLPPIQNGVQLLEILTKKAQILNETGQPFKNQTIRNPTPFSSIQNPGMSGFQIPTVWHIF